jgi:hypothetical protein
MLIKGAIAEFTESGDWADKRCHSRLREISLAANGNMMGGRHGGCRQPEPI